MLPGRFDAIALVFSIFAIIIPILFTVVTGIGFFNHLHELAGENPLWPYLWDNIFTLLSGPGALFVGFLITAIGAIVSALRNFRCNMREIELRKAFGVGLWHGYQKNFLDRVAQSFTDKGLPPPIIVVGSPSLNVVSSAFDVRRFLSKQVPAAMEQYGYSMLSVYGEGDAPYFRQAFKIKGQNDMERPIFFDLPTTFVAFEGAIQNILKRRKKYLSDDKKEKYFDELKGEFFDATHEWSRVSGAPVHEVHIDNQDPDAFAKRLSELLYSISQQRVQD